VLLSKRIAVTGIGNDCRAARWIHKLASNQLQILSHGIRCEKTRRGSSLARDQLTLRWSIPCRAAANRGRAQARRWERCEAHEGNGSRKRAGRRRGEIPRGPNARRAAVVGSWLTPRLAVANLRREQGLEGEASSSRRFPRQLGGQFSRTANTTKETGSERGRRLCEGKKPWRKTLRALPAWNRAGRLRKTQAGKRVRNPEVGRCRVR